MRQKLKVEGRKIGDKYRQIIKAISQSGVGYPVHQFLRDLAIEYTHRYASSGVANQPANFNYFEAFCAIKLIGGSVAPYAEPVEELDHLFSVADYFDYLTAEGTPQFNVADLREMPEGRIYHFTQNGSITDFTYMTAEGREFVISGFSMVRRGDSLHWYVLGGEVLSDAEWQERSENDTEFEIEHVAPEKLPFLSDSMKRTGNRSGAPVALLGTKTAVRTIIAGETDLTTSKHVARCYMTETENSFMLFCDDPDTFSNVQDKAKREKIIAQMHQRVERASVMWNLAEGFFQLPRYFQFRVTIPKDAVLASGKPAPNTTVAYLLCNAHAERRPGELCARVTMR
jgi:hypothetical protein